MLHFLAPSLMLAPQDAAPVAPTFWSRVWALGAERGVVEILLAATVLAVVVVLWWRLARLVSGARSRRALLDYLLGVEQALHGDLQGAQKRLTAVVDADPENHYARLLLGKVLAELGEPAKAHTQHLYLQRAFGIDSPENDLMLAQSLLGAGMPAEAASAAERALQRAPERADGWEFVYRARLQSGDFDGAAVAGRRLLELLRDGGRRSQLGKDLARTLAQAGAQRLRRGDAAAATLALQQAARLHPESDALPLLSARLEAARDGVDRTARARLAEAPQPGALVVAGAPGSVTAASGLPMATLAGLTVPSRWRCRACGVPLPGALGECPRCRSRAPGVLQEPALVTTLAQASHTMDAIDQNDAYVQRLVRALLDGEGAQRATARGELLDLREAAVEELLRQAWHRSGDGQAAAIELLRAMGPAIAPALFAASDALEQQRLFPVGSRSPAALVGRIVQGFDRSALPHVGPLFSSARPEHRKILIDFFLGLADLDEFQLVLERFPPLEILHRFNKSDSAVLRRFLQAVPAGHFVAESLLLEPAFYREDEVLAAIPGARHPEVLTHALLRRGPTRTLTKALIAALDEPELAEVAQRILGQLGAPVTDHVLAAYTDLERPVDERRRLGDVLAAIGVPAVEDLCSSFAPEPSAFDDELGTILVAIGDPAVPALQEAYERSGWLEKVSIGLIARHTNRRVQIVHTLRRLGSPAAAAALRKLRTAERDPNLRLRLDQALHELGAGTDSTEARDGLG
ncbi:MAG: tetratricopeptide repeat protein [Planctomycetes bacterium]|nr:tetratricopeptide repeat protein [Planctomycetota bacterium]